VQAGRPVYLMVAYAADWNLWMDLLNSTDPAYVDNQVTMLVSFVMEYKICGIIYENINIYYVSALSLRLLMVYTQAVESASFSTDVFLVFNETRHIKNLKIRWFDVALKNISFNVHQAQNYLGCKTG